MTNRLRRSLKDPFYDSDFCSDLDETPTEGQRQLNSLACLNLESHEAPVRGQRQEQNATRILNPLAWLPSKKPPLPLIWRNRELYDKIGNIQVDQIFELEGDDYSNTDIHVEVTSLDLPLNLPLIRLDVIYKTTKQFSDENKLGEGGFGPVYRGTLEDGKEVAVKRLSRTSGQRLTEFLKEVILIPKLQHRNLVRLLGCCLEKNERLLIYEYMPNNLDDSLFASSTRFLLDWQRRLSITNGIARGLLYLHEDSRLRIIHRDLKPSNILLDYEMNPKITDFGLAIIFSGNQSEAKTCRIVGTFGYMAPEYALYGRCSVKIDVFSFGVLLLEIISGKKNSHFRHSEEGYGSILCAAWELWCKGQGLELMDPILEKSYVATEVLKCIHIGLLCVQEDPADRPTMSSVLFMLASDITTLPIPRKPAYYVDYETQSPESSFTQTVTLN